MIHRYCIVGKFDSDCYTVLANVVRVFVILISSTKIINTLIEQHLNMDYYCVDAASMSIDSEGLSLPCVNTPKVRTLPLYVYLLEAQLPLQT